MCLDCPTEEQIELGDWAYEDGVDLESVAITAAVDLLMLDYRAHFYGAVGLGHRDGVEEIPARVQQALRTEFAANIGGSN